MTQMAGENLFGLLSLAKQHNIDIGGLEDIDLQGLGGPVETVEPKIDGSLIGLDTVEDKFGLFKKPIPGSNKGFDDLDDATKKYIMDLLNNKKADASLGGAVGTAFGSPITASGSVIKDLEVDAKGFEDAPQWLRDQYWKKDLKGMREAEEEERRKLKEETLGRIRMLDPRF